MEQNRQGEGGTGSAENLGKSRQEQQHPQDNTPTAQEVKNALGKNENQFGSLQDTGAFSGRDDLSGGDNDGMTAQHSGKDTER